MLQVERISARTSGLVLDCSVVQVCPYVKCVRLLLPKRPSDAVPGLLGERCVVEDETRKDAIIKSADFKTVGTFTLSTIHFWVKEDTILHGLLISVFFLFHHC